MTLKMKLYGRCPNCCPNGGACFERVHGDSGWEKRCTNCFRVYPIRKVKKTGKPNATQQKILDRLAELGWQTEVKLMGRKVWLSAKNPSRNWLLGNSLYGTIGPAGAFRLTLQQLFKPAVITDDIGINVYLKGGAGVRALQEEQEDGTLPGHLEAPDA